MKGIFPDVKEGSRITGIHIPNEAARFYLNGKLLGEIRDPEFAHSFFAIWLDKKTSARICAASCWAIWKKPIND
jgi:hypothetical protein